MADDLSVTPFRVTAPLRIDLAGSWCDCPQYTDRYGDASTLNLAVLPGAACLVRARQGQTEVTLRSPEGLPVGSGLGCSAALSVAHVASVRLGAVFGTVEDGTRAEIAEAAYRYERALSGQLAGRQDHYAAAFGGLRLYHWGLTNGTPRVAVDGLPADPALATWVAARLSVFYTGRRRASGAVHEDMWSDLTEERLDILRAMAEGARAAAAAIERADEAELGARVDEQRRDIERLCPAATVPQLDHLAAVLGTDAVLGAKALGAGGGGCVMVLHPAEAREHVRRDVCAAFGWTVWRFEPALEGVTLSEPATEGE